MLFKSMDNILKQYLCTDLVKVIMSYENPWKHRFDHCIWELNLRAYNTWDDADPATDVFDFLDSVFTKHGRFDKTFKSQQRNAPWLGIDRLHLLKSIRRSAWERYDTVDSDVEFDDNPFLQYMDELA